MFRSEEMTHFSLYLPADTAKACVAEMGTLSLIHFRNINNSKSFEKTFAQDIKQVEEVLRKIRWMEKHLDVQIEDSDFTNLKISEVESKVNDVEQRMLALVQSRDTMESQMISKTQHIHVIEHFGQLTSNERYSMISSNESDVGTKVIAGVISREKMSALERILWKTLRGNLYMSTADIDITTEKEIQHKCVFVFYAHGSIMEAKISKICASLGSQLYNIELESSKRYVQLEQLNSQLKDIQQVLATAKQSLMTETSRLAGQLPQWKTSVLMELKIYETLNQMNTDGKSFIAEGWCPTISLNSIQRVLRSVSEQNGSSVTPILTEQPTTLEPPTFHKTNKFTKCFQEIIDAYGMAKYQEVNPGLFTIISFPFLFAVMFGDFGHGIIGTCLAAYLIYKEKQLAPMARKSEMFNMLFAGRYIMLLMFLFSIFTGLIYNDAFSKTVYFSESKFFSESVDGDHKILPRIDYYYPFGIDHLWNMSENKLLFLNSYKMKMSVIMGVTHMSLGIFLTIFNYIHFKHASAIILEFVPQIIFLHSIFGYLVIMIFAKWNTQWLDQDGNLLGEPPALLNMLIFMFLSPGNLDGKPFYDGQAVVQTILVLVALICVPWMLLGKPYMMRREHNKRIGEGYGVVPSRSNSIDADSPVSPKLEKLETQPIEDHEQGEKFDFSEVMIQQVIHTIEFCLGAVSNTASYLRLWALSLAHART
eukprot:NODE_178_length_14069_cov_0.746815.p1 type:complete len:705 gc:universal NODE_178_length_14069_cov_0.746815:10274-12388(+)